ncbi:MAG: hypothetical protein NO483_05780 [Candidatus Methanomethylicia archaeon]|nr:hypothetical protein [Candidatus Methanomethylicia archaeon]
MKEVESFDVFDTILTRRFIYPTDLFYFLGLLFNKDGLISLHPKDFQKARINAERIARSQSKFEEITIDEIYEVLKRICKFNDEITLKLKNKELELELLESIPIRENVRKLHHNVILVSDTYLPKYFLEALLRKNMIHIYQEIFVSSEIKHTKASGGMYDFILKNFIISKHTGDNSYSDFKIPKSKGIKCELYLNSRPTRYETLIYRENFIPFEIRALIAGIMRSVRLSFFYENPYEQKLHEVSSNVAAPFLTLFSLWILENAKNLGVNKLYFLTREGEILKEVSSILCEKLYQNLNIKLYHLPCSRRSIFLPACSANDLEPLKWILEDGSEKKRFCKILDLDLNDMLPEKITFEYIVKNKKVLEQILEKACEKREIFVRYLKQLDFDKESKIGVIDVGWRGRIAKALSRILELSNLYNNDFGIIEFYVKLIPTITVKIFKKNKRLIFFDLDKYDYIFFGACEIFEIFASAKHGSCIGYKLVDDVAYPILENNKDDNLLKFNMDVWQNAIKSFAKDFAESIDRYKIDCSQIVKYSKTICEILLSNFIYFPDRYETEIFSEIYHQSDTLHSRHKKLCRKLTFGEVIIFNLPHQFNKFKPKDIIWTEGSNVLTLPILIAYSINYLRLLYKRFKNIRKNMLYNDRELQYVTRNLFSLMKVSIMNKINLSK